MTGPITTDPLTTTSGALGTPGLCTLGDLTFRIAPSQLSWEYHLDHNVVNTIGGRVIQVYGATLGDMTLQGLFGHQRNGNIASPNTQRIGGESMFQARNFATQIQKMVDAQGARPTKAQLTRADTTPMHKPFRFTYTGDGVHEWEFDVYIKGLHDIEDPTYTVSHSAGKFSYGYDLQLFIVEELSGALTQIATDAYIERLAKGIGWQRTVYNGMMTNEDLQKYLSANSPDGTIHGLILKEYQDASLGKFPEPGTIAASPIPGGAATGAAAGTPGASPNTTAGQTQGQTPGENVQTR